MITIVGLRQLLDLATEGKELPTTYVKDIENYIASKKKALLIGLNEEQNKKLLVEASLIAKVLLPIW